MTNVELIEKAKLAKSLSYAKYSNFHVGSALLSMDNQITLGCNIENSSYGLTICAERVAAFKAISEGIKNFKAIAIVSDDHNFCSPCGACRQVLWELCGDIDVVMANHNDDIRILKLSELLPYPFDDSSLK